MNITTKRNFEMLFICLNFAAMTKQNSLVILRTLIRHCHKDSKMTASNANVSESLDWEHCTLVHLRILS